MKSKIYKFSAITFIIINFINLYFFYDYFTEKPVFLHGFNLLINFFELTLISLGVSIIILLIRLFCYIKKKDNYFKTNFLYVFLALFSFNILLNWLICFSLKIIDFKSELTFVFLGLFFISTFMLIDIYRNNFKMDIIL